MPLKKARSRRDELRRLLDAGTNPSTARKAAKAAVVASAGNTFEAVAREWFQKNLSKWKPSHSRTILQRFELYVFPAFGPQPIADITSAQLLALLRQLEARSVRETAHRVLQLCGQVFRYAVATSRVTSDPTPALRGSLTPATVKHFSAVIDPSSASVLLRMLDGYEGSPVVRIALQLAPLVFARPGELRSARWSDMDLDGAQWRYTVTKTDSLHIVPLATQAVALLRELHALTGTGTFVFPGMRSASRPMSNNAILAAMRRLGIAKEEMTGHGFRAMARTMLVEQLHYPEHLIEQQIAHKVRDPLGRAYNRTTHLPERTQMMQAWADYLDTLRRQDKPA